MELATCCDHSNRQGAHPMSQVLMFDSSKENNL